MSIVTNLHAKERNTEKKHSLRKTKHLNALVGTLLMSDFLVKNKGNLLLKLFKYAFFRYNLLKRRLNHCVKIKN